MAESATVFVDAAILLGAAVVAAPLFKKIGLGTVLGYLFAGIAIGPLLGYMHAAEGEEVLQVAELGVVFLLFIVGLELKPNRLWQMRTEIFGLGASQVIVSGLLLALAAWITHFEINAALAVGFGLALSSTAFALQLLQERGDEHKAYGRRAFSILLFQDIAIAPLLIAVPLLAFGGMEMGEGTWLRALIAIGAIIALIVLGRYAVNYLFDIIAATGAREAMIAAALFIVLGAALLMDFAGLSMAMGAFVAGVMLAESRYRHELEANIEPFRGILLGLFFMAVGLSVELSIVLEHWLTIVLLVPALMAIKTAVLYLLCRAFGSVHNDAVRVAFLLPQHGEFGFVLFSAAAATALINSDEASFLIACVTLSMMLTPLSSLLGNAMISESKPEEMDEDFQGAGTSVLMIGFSRLGQIAAQPLLAGGCDVTILENNASRIRNASRFGFRIYFGDGRRKDVLVAAGIKQAKIVAICTNEQSTTDQIVDLILSEFPDVDLYVRAYDRGHAIELINRGVTYQVRETFESALAMGAQLLKGLGYSQEESDEIVRDIRYRDMERLRLQVVEGSIDAGSDQLHTRPVPEPLIQPRRSAQPIGEEAQVVLSSDDES